MRLPGADRAIVGAAKVRDYLLSLEHPVGRFKARVFLAAGYSRTDWAALQRDLQVLARTADALPGRTTPYGQLYEVRGILPGSPGRALGVVTVWIVRPGEDEPCFVTAYPRASG
jgi:hypothetical protein